METVADLIFLAKNVSLTLATQEAIERKLEMRVDALEEAVIHIGTELQALKVKMALPWGLGSQLGGAGTADGFWEPTVAPPPAAGDGASRESVGV